MHACWPRWSRTSARTRSDPLISRTEADQAGATADIEHLTDNFWGIIPKGSEQQERMARNVPVGRLGSREDVAHAIEFFLDERSDFVTGQVLYVCGGTSLVGLGP